MQFTNLLSSLGSVVESQSRNRIQNEKRSPTGQPWKDWGAAYAASKHGASKGHRPHPGQLRSSQGHTLLSLDGHLLESLHFQTTFDELEVGSNLIYANRQNEERPFLGLSQDNTAEALEVIEQFLDREMGLK